MGFNNGRLVTFDTSHSNHRYAPQCSKCIEATFPGDTCIEFGHEAGFIGVKCNHFLTILDSNNLMQYLFTTPETHDAWHAALENAQPQTPEQFRWLVWDYFDLSAWDSKP